MAVRRPHNLSPLYKTVQIAIGRFVYASGQHLTIESNNTNGVNF